jgi:hypothetical protein
MASAVVLVELEGIEPAAAALDAPVVAEGVDPDTTKSVLVPVGTLSGRLLGG